MIIYTLVSLMLLAPAFFGHPTESARQGLFLLWGIWSVFSLVIKFSAWLMGTTTDRAYGVALLGFLFGWMTDRRR